MVILSTGCTKTVRQDWKDGIEKTRLSQCENMSNDGYQPNVDSSSGLLIKCTDTWEQSRRHEAVENCVDSGGKLLADPETGEIKCRSNAETSL